MSYYSGNPGQASRENLIAYSKALFNHLIDVEKVPSESIDIMAHSLGCAVALDGLAARSKEKNASHNDVFSKCSYSSRSQLHQDAS
jgi:hypothetical protein